MHPRDYSNIRRLTYQERMPRSWSLEGLEILLHIDSFCLGDTICFASFLDAFADRYRPRRLVVSTFWPELFQDGRFEFVDATAQTHVEVDKLVSIGFQKEDLEHIRNGMIWGGRDMMGLPQDTPLGRPHVRPMVFEKKRKVSIATESLKEIARWDRPGGWADVASRLMGMGYEVHNVSYERGEEMEGVVYHSGNDDVGEALNHIGESAAFIGLSSGLSWLAWAYDVPVVMISGFTKHYNEFPCHRVSNERVCNGCFNVFKGISTPCPLFMGSDRQNECHNSITPDMVMEKAKIALSDFQASEQYIPACQKYPNSPSCPQ
jgi:autotransporter strand-loop-strand O-heptosyltransferase